MPQLDKLTYLNEFFVVVLTVCLMYFLLAYIVLPVIYRNIYIRNLKLDLYYFVTKSFLGVSALHGMLRKKFTLYDLLVNSFSDSSSVYLAHRIFNFKSPLSWITGWHFNIMHFYFVAFEKETHYGWVRPFFDVDRKLRRKVKKFRLLWKFLLRAYISTLTFNNKNKWA